ncbi:MAG: hypothetical protein MZU97_17325 [Bacillus subtilis]|nr:hypothetical protein [Bacillus subtilis]
MKAPKTVQKYMGLALLAPRRDFHRPFGRRAADVHARDRRSRWPPTSSRSSWQAS